jgi:hypothetical protein
MAGKHVGSIVNTAFAQPGVAAQTALFRPVFPGTRVDRAYAEARWKSIKQAGFATNPFTAGSPANAAWALGSFNYNIETSNAAVQSHAWNNPASPNP